MSDESNYQRNRTSSDDELRDRIAGILADTYSPGGRGVQFEDVVAAEAIIDHIRTDEAVERVARLLACLEPGEEWPSNEALGGNLTGTRDHEYRDGMRDQAREAIDALLGTGGSND
ncbi:MULTISPECIES: hypothetical protein [Brevibacterium]|uniref:Uncharacterized protein n=1 Tax=Brevibacterium antiquum CNRZ 918 TaxID=1255637 RepID=A0A2H1KEL9_9MICO|nr:MULTISPECIES: hypothetical protein [Brevibacterium]SMX97994.1 hypothetical protein BANT918_02380 [Brevibacterium antiquum CNRZ 918]HCG55342.1 hypothetical protein [Brevibacterium sp.]